MPLRDELRALAPKDRHPHKVAAFARLAPRARRWTVDGYRVRMVDGPTTGPTGLLEYRLTVARDGRDMTPADNHCQVQNPPVIHEGKEDLEGVLGFLVAGNIAHWRHIGWLP